MVSAAPGLRLLIQEGSSSSGEAEYSTKKYQQIAGVLGTYLKREIQVTGLSPLRQFDGNVLRQGDILIVRPNAVAGMAIQTLGFVPVVGLDSGIKSQMIFVGPAALKKNFKSPDVLKKLRFAMPPADSEVTHQAMRLLANLGVKPDSGNVYNVQLQGTIPFALENKLADVGVIKSDAAVAPKLATAGYVVLGESEAAAPWVMLANNKLGAETIDQIRVSMMSMMSNADHKAALQAIRVQNIVETDALPYVNAYNHYNGK